MTFDKYPKKDGLEDLKSRIEVSRPMLAEERISSAKQIANRTASEAFGVAFSFVICILIGTVGGYALDNALGTKPLFFVVGFFIGFVLGIWYMIFKARQVAKRDEE
jgi:F0F1-type ATP synthase assembly protein I